MKLTFILTTITIFICTSINAQETTKCKCGVLIGNSGNTNRASTIIYSKVFDAKCEKGTTRLRLDNGAKSQIRVQFFQFLKKNHPAYLAPFKNTRVSSIQVRVIPSDQMFKDKIDRDFGTSHINFDMKRVDDFILTPIKSNSNRTEAYRKNFREMNQYLGKKRK